MSSKSYTQIYIEILQINKYNEYMILVHDTMHYGDNILNTNIICMILQYDTSYYDQPYATKWLKTCMHSMKFGKNFF
jgi:hypothetical protein